MNEYVEPVEHIVDLFRTIFQGNPFNAIYDGDPDEIPESCLPAICVKQIDDTNNQGAASGTDDVSVQIQIRVVFDKRDDWGEADPTVELTDRKIRKIVESREANTNQYSLNSIKGALRRRLQLPDGAYVRQDMRFQMPTTVRPGGMVTSEGVLTITIDYMMNRGLLAASN